MAISQQFNQLLIQLL